MQSVLPTVKRFGLFPQLKIPVTQNSNILFSFVFHCQNSNNRKTVCSTCHFTALSCPPKKHFPFEILPDKHYMYLHVNNYKIVDHIGTCYYNLRILWNTIFKKCTFLNCGNILAISESILFFIFLSFQIFRPCSWPIEVPGQGLNLPHSSDPSHSNDNAGSLIARPLGNSSGSIL